MNLESFSGEGSTPSRRRFWDKVTQAVIASQKIAGKNVTCDEHQGTGTVVNVADNRRPTGACQITFSGITLCTGCIDGLDLGFGQSINNLTETNSVNDTYPLSDDIICSSVPALRGGGAINRLNYDRWTTSPSCSGPPDGNVDTPVSIFVRCVAGVWSVWMLDNSALVLFAATGITDISSIPNSITGSGDCGSTKPDPCNDVTPTDDLVIAYGGTAVITSCTCPGT